MVGVTDRDGGGVLLKREEQKDVDVSTKTMSDECQIKLIQTHTSVCIEPCSASLLHGVEYVLHRRHMTEFQKNCFDKSTKKLSHSVTGSEVDTEAEMAQ